MSDKEKQKPSVVLNTLEVVKKLLNAAKKEWEVIEGIENDYGISSMHRLFADEYFDAALDLLGVPTDNTMHVDFMSETPPEFDTYCRGSFLDEFDDGKDIDGFIKTVLEAVILMNKEGE